MPGGRYNYEKGEAVMYDICIIGGGASGLSAAVTCLREDPSLSVCVIEKMDRPGRKISASGNGRCNITNAKCESAEASLSFFRSIGVETVKENEGRFYPRSGRAEDVVKALVSTSEALGAAMMTDFTVTKTERGKDGAFEVYGISGGEGITVKSKKLLIASGGKAAPQFGTSGDGYAFAKSFGHTVTKLAPVLTSIKSGDISGSLKGTRAKGLCALLRDGEAAYEEYGEVQFAEGALSGICIMDLSRFLKLEGKDIKKEFGRYRVEIDFMTEKSEKELSGILLRRKEIPGLMASDIFLSIVPSRLAEDIVSRSLSEISPGAPASDISGDEIERLAKNMKNWSARVTGAGGWKDAQCTSGGVKTEEINMDTMQSRIIDGLYFAGEIIDRDWQCGGFNLQNAWETGIKAGKAMAR